MLFRSSAGGCGCCCGVGVGVGRGGGDMAPVARPGVEGELAKLSVDSLLDKLPPPLPPLPLPLPLPLPPSPRISTSRSGPPPRLVLPGRCGDGRFSPESTDPLSDLFRFGGIGSARAPSTCALTHREHGKVATKLCTWALVSR